MVSDSSHTKWVPEKMLNTFQVMGWRATGETKMDYALPSWLIEANGRRLVLVLDDMSRGTPMMMNAIMTLVHEQSFASWLLPKGSTIIITTNPSDGDFNTSSLDSAQSTRFLKVFCKASVDDWSLWAHGKVQERFISFLVHHPEIIEKVEKDANNQVIEMGNLRSWTKYFNAVSFYEDLNSNWTTILNLGSGSFPKEHLNLLYAFIQDKLDRIDKPADILYSKDIESTVERLKELTKSREDISTLITKRLYNEIVSSSENKTKEELEKYTLLIADNYMRIIEAGVLNEDILYLNMQRFTKKLPRLFAELLKRNQKRMMEITVPGSK